MPHGRLGTLVLAKNSNTIWGYEPLTALQVYGWQLPRCPREMQETRATPQAAAQFRGTATNQNHTKRLHHSRRTQELRQFRWSTTSRSDTGTNTSPRRRAHLGDEIACRGRGIARPSWYNSTARSSVRSKPPTTEGPPECPCSTQRRWSPYRTRSSVRP